MMTRRLIPSLLLVFAAAVEPTFAATLIVDAAGGGDYTAIQPALTAASNGDTVLVVAGVYTGAANRNLSFLGKNLTLASVSGAATTVIDAENAGRAFTFSAGETGTAVVDGFTVTRAPTGSPVRVTGGAWPTIRRCVIQGNDVIGVAGGAVFCQDSSPTFEDCVFVENTTDQFAGAIYVQGGAPTFDGCTVVGNATAGRGGGFYLTGGANVSLVDSTVTGNGAGLNGGGVVVTGDSQVDVQRTIVWGNRATTFDDLFVAAGCDGHPGVCSDVDADGSGGGGVINVGAGVLTGDPHFCQPAYCRDAALGRWRLRPGRELAVPGGEQPLRPAHRRLAARLRRRRRLDRRGRHLGLGESAQLEHARPAAAGRQRADHHGRRRPVLAGADRLADAVQRARHAAAHVHHRRGRPSALRRRQSARQGDQGRDGHLGQDGDRERRRREHGGPPRRIPGICSGRSISSAVT